jgi:Uma2 family endonuclease
MAISIRLELSAMAITDRRPQAAAIPQRMSLEAYLTYDDGTDARYELVDGVLVEMGVESTINAWIATYLIYAFAGLGIPSRQVGLKQKIEVKSAFVSARDPDLIIHSEASALALEGRKEACLRWDEPNPRSVIEVVSPGERGSENYERDYVQKPVEYAARGIAEYWIIDPSRAWVKVGTLTDGMYQFQTFTGPQLIESLALPAMALTAEQVLTAGG